MELILYYIKESRMLLLTYLILIFFIAVIGFFYMRNFSQEKKSKIIFYGLLLQMNNIDIIKISTIIIKTFIMIYAISITKPIVVFLCMIMTGILSLLYILIFIKRAIYEIICTCMQIAIIYLINIINNYRVETENNLLVLLAKIVLIIFALMFTTYIFFKEIDVITRDRERKKINMINKKQQKSEEVNNA